MIRMMNGTQRRILSDLADELDALGADDALLRTIEQQLDRADRCPHALARKLIRDARRVVEAAA